MKRVYDNIIYSHQNVGGVSNYWYLLTAPKVGEENVFFMENELVNTNYYRQKMAIPEWQIMKDNIYLNKDLSRIIPKKLDWNEPTLFHGSYYRNLRKNKFTKEVVTVHDFIHEKFVKGIKSHFHKNVKYNSIRRSEGIICISQNTLQDLQKYCPPNSAQEVEVIYNAVSEEFHPLDDSDQLLEKYGLNDKPKLLFVGGRTNYKNFDFFISLMEKLPDFQAIVVGPPLTAKEKNSLAQIDYQLFEGVSEEVLNELFNISLALVYPSYYEGFGMPIVEAMQSGTPFLALAISSLKEVGGNAGKLFEELNIEDFKKEIIELQNNEYRAKKVNLGLEQAKKFDLQKNRRLVEEFYSKIINK